MKYHNLKVIIYERKSTDREDMQQASLPAQSRNNKLTVERNRLNALKVICESASAKTHWTRKGFNEMVNLIEEEKAQWIVVDEPTRISRSTLDAATIVHLMETGKIKYVFTSSGIFSGDNIMEVKLLEDMMQWAKVDNKIRSKSVKDKMMFIAENSNRILIKAPFGYQNFREWKAPADVRPHPENYLIWKHMLKLLWEGMTYKDVSLEIFRRYWVGTKNNVPFAGNQIRVWLFHKFHDGLYDFAGRTFMHKHRLVVSSEYVNEIRVKRNHKVFQKTSQEKFPLKGILKAHWGDRLNLTAYTQKGHIYYNSNRKHPYKGRHVNINQEMILDAFENTLDLYVIKDSKTRSRVVKLLQKFFNQLQNDSLNHSQQVKAKVSVIENKQANLLNLLCENKISQKDFDAQRWIYLEEIKKHTKVLDSLSYVNNEILIAAWKTIELLTKLFDTWKNGDLEKKIDIIKMISIELYIDTKKQLYVQENELFELIKILNFWNGGTSTLQSRTMKLFDFMIYRSERFIEISQKVEQTLSPTVNV